MNEVMKSYIKLVDFLASMLGPNYEIVLHDAQKENVPIIAIANSHITGRKINDSATMFALKVIASKQYKDNDYMSNHDAVSKDKKPLRSSMFFIKDNNKLLGLLCINFDDSQFVDLAKSMLELVHPNEIIKKRNEQVKQSEDISETMIETIQKTIEEYFLANSIIATHKQKAQFHNLILQLTQDNRIEVIELLNEKGIFMLKGAVNEVASILEVSEPTIYRYLSKVKDNSLI
ncbi:helix-turn-helix transcriptional regulator [Mycoplasma sp. P36-A1]|uniref:helix-turn-helix transcriptional regulator n=1 Tax=Mycoplasma sp. P36-A1 TaxID=3252900 RepID=UPI003C2EEE1C